MLPLARLAKPGETPSVWPRFHFTKRELRLCRGHPLKSKRVYSMTANAIRLREMRAGTFVPRTPEEARLAMQAAAKRRVRREGISEGVKEWNRKQREHAAVRSAV